MEFNDPQIVNRAKQDALIESFEITGLFGYRDISLETKTAAAVLIARNGSGKTTLLGAMDAFLKCQFLRLSGLQFESIRCKLRGVESHLVLHHSDIEDISQVSDDSPIAITARRFGLDPAVVLEFVENDYWPIRKNFRELREHEVFYKIYTKNGYDVRAATKTLDRLYESRDAQNPQVYKIRSTLQDVLRDVEIVYLPTYRRIELPLADERAVDERALGKRRPSVQSRLGLSKKSLYNADIQFGLSDISDRLFEINQGILATSNQGYREISANIINELLDGSFDRNNTSEYELPDRESLALFFSRIKEGGRVGHVAHIGEVAIPNIDQIYNEGASSYQSNRFLQYFLGKLNAVISATRGIEQTVEDFISLCNTYLCSADISTEVPRKSSAAASKRSSDEKLLILDRKNLSVHVESQAVMRRISLDSLSSGEKQMISMFARLYLYSGNKVVLIDEPELSLSMDWQRKILRDVVSAPSCVQTIAITHSPFVFDNELEPYAKSLRVKVDLPQKTEPEDNDEEEDGGE